MTAVNVTETIIGHISRRLPFSLRFLLKVSSIKTDTLTTKLAEIVNKTQTDIIQRLQAENNLRVATFKKIDILQPK